MRLSCLVRPGVPAVTTAWWSKPELQDDIRLFTVPQRDSANWNKIYNKRTGAERGFALLKEHLGLESSLRVRGVYVYQNSF